MASSLSFSSLSRYTNSDLAGSIDGVYLTGNEARFWTTPTYWKPQANSCHIGCAAWENFDLICRLYLGGGKPPPYTLIFDFNPDNATLLQATADILFKSPGRNQFIRRMKRYLSRNPRNVTFSLKDRTISRRLGAAFPAGKSKKYKLKPEEELIWTSTFRPGSWLSTVERYNFIRQLVLEQKLVCITQDIRNSTAFTSISEDLRRLDLEITSLYLSNVNIFVPFRKCIDTLDTLISGRTLTIYCPSGEINPNPLVQQLEYGRGFLYREPLHLLEEGKKLDPYLGLLRLPSPTLLESRTFREQLYQNLQLAYQLDRLALSGRVYLLTQLPDSLAQLSQEMGISKSHLRRKLSPSLVIQVLRFSGGI